jgi:hypothetical protein
MSTSGWAVASQAKTSKIQSLGRVNRVRKIKKETMKLTLKQRFRNWLMDSDDVEADHDHMYVEEDKLSSDGMRLQIYKASGGFVVETRSYDRRSDRNNNSMHVITDDQDLGEALSKIVLLEALK